MGTQTTDDFGVSSYQHKSGEERTHELCTSRELEHHSWHAVTLR